MPHGMLSQVLQEDVAAAPKRMIFYTRTSRAGLCQVEVLPNRSFMVVRTPQGGVTFGFRFTCAQLGRV